MRLCPTAFDGWLTAAGLSLSFFSSIKRQGSMRYLYSRNRDCWEKERERKKSLGQGCFPFFILYLFFFYLFLTGAQGSGIRANTGTLRYRYTNDHFVYYPFAFKKNFQYSRFFNLPEFGSALQRLWKNITGFLFTALFSTSNEGKSKRKLSVYTFGVYKFFLTNSERIFGWYRNQVTTLTSLYTTQYSLYTTLHFINCSVRHIVLNSLLFHSNKNNVKMFVVLLGIHQKIKWFLPNYCENSRKCSEIQNNLFKIPVHYTVPVSCFGT